MRKLVLAAVGVLTLTGCQQSINDFNVKVSGYNKMCVDGVTWVHFSNTTREQHDINGHLVPCKG